MALEQLNYKSPEGCIANGLHRQVISGLAGGTTPRALLASESGALCLFDDAAGQIYTLPAPVVGLQFDFLVTVTRTSNSHSIDTDAATSFIGGGIVGVGSGAGESDTFAATIASTVSIDFDSATTGEQIGTNCRLICISSTEWVCSGQGFGVGTMATPFA